MAIAVRRGLKGRLRSDQNVIFLVRSAEEDRLGSAMEAVRADIYAMDAGWQSVPGLHPGEANNPSYVSEPIAVPGGRLLMVDFGHVPSELRLQLPDVVSVALERSGIRNASIEPASVMGDRYLNLERFVPIARAWLRGIAEPGAPWVISRPSDDLIEAGLSWLLSEHQAGNELIALAISVEVPLTWGQHRPIIGRLLSSADPLPHETPVLSTDFETQAACARFGEFYGFGLTLAVGGAGWSHGDIALRMERQRELIRKLAQKLEWGAVTVDPDDRNPLSSHMVSQEIPPPNPMWYQVFSPSQLERLGGPPPGSVELPNGRFELTVGQPEQWVPGHPDRDKILRHARALLTGG